MQNPLQLILIYLLLTGPHALAQSMDIVIARYSADIQWVFEHAQTHMANIRQIIIYNKGTDNLNIPERFKNITTIKKLPNVGRCDHTYLYYITHWYEDLPEVVLFWKDSSPRHPRFHAEEFLSLKKTCAMPKRYNTSTFELVDWNPSYNQSKASQFIRSPETPMIRWIAKLFGPEEKITQEIKNNPIHICWGGTFSAHRHEIQRTEKKVWQQLLGQMSVGDNIEVGHYMERLWFHLLGKQNKVKLRYRVWDQLKNLLSS